MADAKPAAPAEAAPVASPAAGSGGSKKQSLILIALAVINMFVVVGVGTMIWQGRKKDAAEPKIEHVINGEKQTQDKEKADKEEKVEKETVVPLETFIINLAGSKGRRVAKVNIELSVQNDTVKSEIDQRKAQIRDIIIIMLSGRSYEQVSSREGKEKLKDDLKDRVNEFLSKGKIKDIYFTEFIYN